MYAPKIVFNRIVPATVTQFGASFTPNAITPNLLLHFNGTNGSTIFTDSMGRHFVTPHGNAQIDTTKSVFGGSSGLFAASGDFLTLDDSDDFRFSTGDFTIDCWYNTTTLGAAEYIIDFFGVGDAGNGFFQLLKRTTNTFAIWINNGLHLTSTTIVQSGIWYHVAVTRQSHILRLFINGNAEAGTFDDGGTDYTVGVNGPTIATDAGNTGPLTGSLDEFRLIKGYAAWTSNFAPPTASYPPP